MTQSDKPQKPIRSLFEGERKMLSEGNVKEEMERVVEVLNAGKLEDGIQKMKQLQRWGSESDVLLYNLGVAHNAKGNFKEAVVALNRLIEISPSHVHGHAALATALVSQGDLSSALQIAMKGLDIDSTDPYLLRTTSMLQIEQNDYVAARETLNKAEKKLFGDPGILYLQGEASLGLFTQTNDRNHLKRAELYFHEVISLSPNTSHSDNAKIKLTEIAQKQMRKNSLGQPRMDVVFYIIGYFDKKAKMPQNLLMEHFKDILITSSKGLMINDPSRTYKANVTGDLMTGMHILSFCYAFMRDHNMPYQDLNMNLDLEYEMALTMKKPV